MDIRYYENSLYIGSGQTFSLYTARISIDLYALAAGGRGMGNFLSL